MRRVTCGFYGLYLCFAFSKAHVPKCDPALAYKHPGARPYQQPVSLPIS